jgi:hypothetical protein
VASDPRRLLLQRLPGRVGGLLPGRAHLLVRGAHPLPLVLCLRIIHEVQRARRGLAEVAGTTAENCKYIRSEGYILARMRLLLLIFLRTQTRSGRDSPIFKNDS